jgi:hypothetical protein
MVILEAMPCSNCVFCDGIAQPNGTEIGEYVSCNKSNTGNAIANLKYVANRLSCQIREEKYEE